MLHYIRGRTCEIRVNKIIEIQDTGRDVNREIPNDYFYRTSHNYMFLLRSGGYFVRKRRMIDISCAKNIHPQYI